jgi:hypothetical protein
MRAHKEYGTYRLRNVIITTHSRQAAIDVKREWAIGSRRTGHVVIIGEIAIKQTGPHTWTVVISADYTAMCRGDIQVNLRRWTEVCQRKVRGKIHLDEDQTYFYPFKPVLPCPKGCCT